MRGFGIRWAAAPVALVLAFSVAGCGAPSRAGTPAISTTGAPAGTANGPGSGDVPPGTPTPPDGAGVAGTTAVPVPDVPATSTEPPATVPAFGRTEAAMAARVAEAGAAGGYVLVVRNGTTRLSRGFGSVSAATPMAVASASKALTAATILTLVDDDLVSLDDPVSRWLPAFTGDRGRMTLRQLLSHTSGIGDDDCIWDLGGVLADCVDRLASRPGIAAPGTRFAYGNASYHVAARVAEVASGRDFQTLFAERIGGPLGMSATRWGPGATRNPSAAAGARTTVDDYARFLAMILDGGVVGTRRILQPASVVELQRDQVVGFDTSGDAAVRITRTPTYGLGLWRDVVGPRDESLVVSMNGALGFYPWVDHRTGSYGIVAVEDRRGAEVAVPASRRVVDQALADLGP